MDKYGVILVTVGLLLVVASIFLLFASISVVDEYQEKNSQNIIERGEDDE